MRFKFVYLFLVTLFFTPVCINAQTKRALVIGIGNYEDSAWDKINGDRDVPYVLEILNNANYSQIITCVNEEATKAGVITLAVLLTAMGLPTDYIGMFMAIDILCDMPKTLLNAYSVSCSAIIVARSEAEMLKI